MADLADPAQSPSVHDDALATGNGNGVPGGENRGVKRPRVSAAAADDDDDDDDNKPGRERRKIDIKFIQDKSRRHITFSKRKAGIMKKASQPAWLQRATRLSHRLMRRFHPVDEESVDWMEANHG